MPEKIVTASRAAETLGISMDDIPDNKCITKAELEEIKKNYCCPIKLF